MTFDTAEHTPPTLTVSEMNVARGTEDRDVIVRTIAANILDVREAAGVTRKAMARTLGVTATTLWCKETGGTEFKASELVTIATVCGVDVSRLMTVEAWVAIVVVPRGSALSLAPELRAQRLLRRPASGRIHARLRPRVTEREDSCR